MESLLSSSDKQRMVSSFLEIAVGQSSEIATQFLQATSWCLEDAIQLFYIGNDSLSNPLSFNSQLLNSSTPSPSNFGVDSNGRAENGHDYVRPPLPVIRDTLFDGSMLQGASIPELSSQKPASVVAFRNFEEENKRLGVWDSDQASASTADNPRSAADNPRDNLASLYRPPFALMYQGPFEKAKAVASEQDRWLLVNLQSASEFTSHMLNRDTWANETLAQTITSNFVFWQAYDDSTEGRKVCTYYKVDSAPVVIVIDPVTGQKMRSWCGMVQPERLLEDLLLFMDNGPRTNHISLSHKRPREGYNRRKEAERERGCEGNDEEEDVQRALAASLESMSNIDGDQNIRKEEDEAHHVKEKPSYPPLPEEAKGDKTLTCRVGVRLPDGRRLQRSFFRTDPIQLLWSLCAAEMGEGGSSRGFRLTHAIPGSLKSLDYNRMESFEESGIANSIISVTWL